MAARPEESPHIIIADLPLGESAPADWELIERTAGLPVEDEEVALNGSDHLLVHVCRALMELKPLLPVDS